MIGEESTSVLVIWQFGVWVEFSLGVCLNISTFIFFGTGQFLQRTNRQSPISDVLGDNTGCQGLSYSVGCHPSDCRLWLLLIVFLPLWFSFLRKHFRCPAEPGHPTVLSPCWWLLSCQAWALGHSSQSLVLTPLVSPQLSLRGLVHWPFLSVRTSHLAKFVEMYAKLSLSSICSCSLMSLRFLYHHFRRVLEGNRDKGCGLSAVCKMAVKVGLYLWESAAVFLVRTVLKVTVVFAVVVDSCYWCVVVFCLCQA